MRGLVEPDCGGVNPLVRLTNRYTADRARVAEGVGTSRQAGQDGRVSSQGLVRKFLFTRRTPINALVLYFPHRFESSWRRRGMWPRGRLTHSGWIPSCRR